MVAKTNSFGPLFKKYRLRSGFATIREFADALAEKGFVFDESLFSHWQKNSRLPKERKLLLTTLKIFIEKEGVSSTKEINVFLESVGQGYLTEQESAEITTQRTSFFPEKISIKKILKFFISTAKSKRIVRTGWKMKKIKNPESVAEHSFQLSVMAMIFADQFNLDKEKLIKMAILHDLGEVVTGDVVWSMGKIIDLEKRKEKELVEMRGITKIFKIINRPEEYQKIYKEMMERKSLEATIFWQLDKLEMALQALEYEKKYHKDLSEFFINADLQIQHPFLRKILKQTLKDRPPHRQ